MGSLFTEVIQAILASNPAVIVVFAGSPVVALMSTFHWWLERRDRKEAEIHLTKQSKRLEDIANLLTLLSERVR